MAQGKAVTFMSKWRYDLAGSSSHIHMSLWDEDGKTPLFLDAKAEFGMSRADALVRRRPAQVCAATSPVFLAPYINSYKRFQAGTFAPTKAVWSRDNRTAGFRLCGEGSKAHPHRVPHRRRRPQSLSRLRGADRGRPRRHRREARRSSRRSRATPTPARSCPRCRRRCARRPTRLDKLRDAARRRSATRWSTTTCTPAKWEQFEYDRRITDWELMRGFERY